MTGNKKTFYVYIPTSYGEKGLKARDEIEKKLEKMGKWVGHGTGFGYHDVQFDFKDEKSVERGKTVAVNVMFNHGVSGKFKILNIEKPVTTKPLKPKRIMRL
jgi:hypothetical protein